MKYWFWQVNFHKPYIPRMTAVLYNRFTFRNWAIIADNFYIFITAGNGHSLSFRLKTKLVHGRSTRVTCPVSCQFAVRKTMYWRWVISGTNAPFMRSRPSLQKLVRFTLRMDPLVFVISYLKTIFANSMLKHIYHFLSSFWVLDYPKFAFL